MNLAAARDLRRGLHAFTQSSRPRLYGMCLVITLSFLVVGRITDNATGWVEIYLPLAGATMLVISLAGAEFQLYLDRHHQEQLERAEQLKQSDRSACERQRTFNRLWQVLADTPAGCTMQEETMTELVDLFAADMVAVWSARGAPAGYRLAGAHPLNRDATDRLSKIGQVAPCFDRLKDEGCQLQITDFRQQTAPALAWFCDDQHLHHAVFNPVMVRQELVGVLAFFYRDEPLLTTKRAEEMQAAANLFLCAL
jgi:hypothetical protein